MTLDNTEAEIFDDGDVADAVEGASNGSASVDTPLTPPFVLVRDKNPYAALGRASSMLQRFPNFALLPFGQINSLIMGAVNRSHYNYILKDGEPVGFFAWAFTDGKAAQKWLTDNDPAQIGDGTSGDSVVFNVWHIDPAFAHDAEISRFLVRSFREMFADKTALYARRVYPNGRIKSIKIPNRRQ